MPGLIESLDYTAAKKKISTAPRMADLIDAIETALLNSTTFDRFPLEKMTSKGPVRSHQLPTGTGQSVVVIFAFEGSGGETKVLLLEVWISEGTDEDSS